MRLYLNDGCMHNFSAKFQLVKLWLIECNTFSHSRLRQVVLEDFFMLTTFFILQILSYKLVNTSFIPGESESGLIFLHLCDSFRGEDT